MAERTRGQPTLQTLNHRDTAKAKSILKVFAQYGLRKTSMEEIATAAGLSRQSIYKKFGSKEQCYAWAIHAYLTEMYTRIFAALSNNEIPPMRTLTDVFDILIGNAVEIVRDPQGPQVLSDALKATHASSEDWPLRLRARLAGFLEHHGYASHKRAEGVAFTLISAGKGLLLEEPSREQFLDDMQIIIESICQSS